MSRRRRTIEAELVALQQRRQRLLDRAFRFALTHDDRASLVRIAREATALGRLDARIAVLQTRTLTMARLLVHPAGSPNTLRYVQAAVKEVVK